MKTCAVFFPFDLFGSGGAGAGVDLLADELREILADNRRERVCVLYAMFAAFRERIGRGIRFPDSTR